MRIGLTYDLQTDPADERQAEFDRPTTIDALEGALRSLGHEVVRLGSAEQLLASPERLRNVTVVFNIAEGTHGRCREAWVPMLLEQWDIPFVGSGIVTQMLALDKVMSKRLVSASGIVTPRWTVIDRPEACGATQGLRFPLIVKPRFEGSGIGIDPGAVVHDEASLRQRVEWLIGRVHQPCLIEEFISFGELTVLVIGNTPPIAPLADSATGGTALPAIQRPLDPASRLSCHVVPGAHAAWLSPIELTPELDATARDAAVIAFNALRCRDVARVDFRLDEAGTLYFLEINTLPSFDPEGTVGLIAEHLGVTYAQLIGRVLQAALDRCGLAVTAHR